MNLTFPEVEQASDYRRELDLSQAIARVQYQTGGVKYSREIFSSPVDQVIVARISCDQPGKLNFNAALRRQHHSEVKGSGSDTMIMTGQAKSTQKENPRIPSGSTGTRFAVHMKIIPTGGAVTFADGMLKVKEADAALILLSAATDFAGDAPLALSEKQLNAAMGKSYENLRDDHVAEHRRLYDRVKLELNGDANMQQQPTDQRLAAVKKGATDLSLIQLYFNFGRYLMISTCLLYTSPSPRDQRGSRMPSSA